MFPSNFTKEILTESDTPADTPGSQEELRSGRTSEPTGWWDGRRRAKGRVLKCWCLQVRTVQGVKATEGTVDRTRAQ